MTDKEIYSQILQRLYDGLKTQFYDKYKNDRLGERKFTVEEVYPDVILTEKDSRQVEFTIEIALPQSPKRRPPFDKWKTLSEAGPAFFLLVPQENYTGYKSLCSQEKITARFGTYQFHSGRPLLRFF